MEVLFSIGAKYLTSFGKFNTIGQIFILENSQILNKLSSHLVTRAARATYLMTIRVYNIDLRLIFSTWLTDNNVQISHNTEWMEVFT